MGAKGTSGQSKATSCRVQGFSVRSIRTPLFCVPRLMRATCAQKYSAPIVRAGVLLDYSCVNILLVQNAETIKTIAFDIIR